MTAEWEDAELLAPPTKKLWDDFQRAKNRRESVSEQYVHALAQLQLALVAYDDQLVAQPTIDATTRTRLRAELEIDTLERDVLDLNTVLSRLPDQITKTERAFRGQLAKDGDAALRRLAMEMDALTDELVALPIPKWTKALPRAEIVSALARRWINLLGGPTHYTIDDRHLVDRIPLWTSTPALRDLVTFVLRSTRGQRRFYAPVNGAPR